jgi:hypothetical protein
MLAALSSTVGYSLSTDTTSDHEMRIARIVDRTSLQEGGLQQTSIADVAIALAFIMTLSDGGFLARYVRWRTANPIAQS